MIRRWILIGGGTWLFIFGWAWLFGPVGFAAGSVAFLGGWALGHRTGRHDAEREAMQAFHRYQAEGQLYVPAGWEEQ